MFPFLETGAQPAVWILVAVSLFTYMIVQSVVHARKLRHIPGPPLAAYTRLWMFWHELRDDWAEVVKATLAKYGSPCRIAPDQVVTDDSDLVRLMAAPGSKWRRSTWYSGMKFDPRQDNMLSTRDEDIHTAMRSKVAGGYNGRDNPTLEKDVDAHVVELIQLIRSKYLNVPMDFASVAQYFTLDTLSSVAFGRPFGFLAANEDLWGFSKMSEDFIQALETANNHTTIQAIMFSPLMQWLAAPKPTDKVGVGRALGFAHTAVAERFGPDKVVRKDMLGSFVSKGLTQAQCEVEAFLQIAAGSDSTTTVLRSALFLLSGHPTSYLRLRTEIDTAIAAGEISSPVIRNTEAIKLPYLQACVWEAMRLFPPLFGLKTKVIPTEGETFKGVFYPPGTKVSLSDYGLCARRDIFGDDVALFRPERFLEGDETMRTSRQRQVEALFGAGRYTCLGKYIAFMGLNKAMVELMRTFDFSIADPTKGIRLKRIVINMQHDMNLVARLRD